MNEKEIMNNHRLLGSNNFEFISEFLKSDAPQRIQFAPALLPEIVQGYPYKVNQLPVFIEDPLLSELYRVANNLPLLLRKVFDHQNSHYFEQIKTYYQLTESDVDKLLAVDVTAHLMTRTDAILTANGIRAIELNLGSKLGGWQTQFFDAAYRELPVIKDLIRQRGDFEFKDIFISYLTNLVRACESLPDHSQGDTKNILFLCDNRYRHEAVQVTKYLSLLSEKLNLRVNISIESDNSTLCTPNGKLVHKGAEIHALLVTQGPGQPIPRAVFEAFCEGQLIWPDNPICDSMNEKKFFEYFFCENAASQLTSDELAQAEMMVPFSVGFTKRLISVNGRSWNIKDFVIENKDQLVIKPSYAARGRDVKVGRFTKEKDWRRIVKDTPQDGSFTIQEYCESLQFYAYDPDNIVKKVQYIFGLYSFSGSYGGTWMRLHGAEECSDGVVNSHLGAQEAIVYETR